MKGVIKANAAERIEGIHKLSEKYNRATGKDHADRLLEMIGKHSVEIKELHDKKDKHSLIETGDLIILCFEYLLENGASIDDVIAKCFERFETKIKFVSSEKIM
ncbi:MAG: hypothetical protein HQL29_04710 [Candidatus Omnitrophica bacterium]|nr:hypothetical protein [Candidatus Omnitrophota bacterium]